MVRVAWAGGGPAHSALITDTVTSNLRSTWLLIGQSAQYWHLIGKKKQRILTFDLISQYQ